MASVPRGVWTWGDPSHRRSITKESLTFLDQDSYKQVGQTTMSDFRHLYKADFKTVFVQETEHTLYFTLQKQ